MTWSPFVIATSQDRGDGRSVPIWAGGSDVSPEPDDGAHPDRFPAPKLLLYSLVDGEMELIDGLEDVSARILVTDSRIAIGCRRFVDKGGGWCGTGMGAAVAVVANGVSKIRAAVAGFDKAVVAHIRYERLRYVGYALGTGFLSSESVGLVFEVPAAPGPMRLDITLPRDLDGSLIAQEILRRTARHRLRHLNHAHSDAHTDAHTDADVGDELRRELAELAEAPPPFASSPGAVRFYEVPQAPPVSPAPAGASLEEEK